MKKTISINLLIAVVLLVTGCSNTKPSASAKTLGEPAKTSVKTSVKDHAQAPSQSATYLTKEAIFVERLPENISDFWLELYKSFESDQPGLGLMARYINQRGWVASAYIYTAGLDPFPGTIFDKKFLEHYQRAFNDMIAVVAQRHQGDSLSVDSLTRDIMGSSEAHAWTEDHAVFNTTDGKRGEHQFIWLAQGMIWKLRLTQLPEGTGELPKDFIDHFFKMSQMPLIAEP